MSIDIKTEIARRRATERFVALADGAIPEMIAGAIVFAVFAITLAVVPRLGQLMTTPANVVVVAGAGALVGAVGSWALNRRARRVTVRSEAPIREDRAAA